MYPFKKDSLPLLVKLISDNSKNWSKYYISIGESVGKCIYNRVVIIILIRPKKKKIKKKIYLVIYRF